MGQRDGSESNKHMVDKPGVMGWVLRILVSMEKENRAHKVVLYTHTQSHALKHRKIWDHILQQ